MFSALPRGFTPDGVISPIAAPVLKSAADHNASLSAFSQQFTPLVGYGLNENGRWLQRPYLEEIHGRKADANLWFF